MQAMMEKRAIELMENGTVDRVLGWSAGEFIYDVTPAVFESVEEIRDKFLYNDFCAANLSKYLVGACTKGGKILVFLKSCDTYSFNQLLAEHRIKRECVYVIGVECYGKADVEKLKKDAADWEAKYTSDIAAVKLDSAVSLALVEAKAKNPKLARAALDMSLVKLDGDKLLGLSEQLENLRKSDAYLFEEEGGGNNSGGAHMSTGGPHGNTNTSENFMASVMKFAGLSEKE